MNLGVFFLGAEVKGVLDADDPGVRDDGEDQAFDAFHKADLERRKAALREVELDVVFTKTVNAEFLPVSFVDGIKEGEFLHRRYEQRTRIVRNREAAETFELPDACRRGSEASEKILGPESGLRGDAVRGVLFVFVKILDLSDGVSRAGLRIRNHPEIGGSVTHDLVKTLKYKRRVDSPRQIVVVAKHQYVRRGNLIYRFDESR